MTDPASADRALPLALGAAAVLGAVAGVVALVTAFAEERAELWAALDSERAAVEREVARALDGAARAHLEVARLRVARALDDPLVEAPGALAIEDGRLVWPRAVGSAPDPGPSLAAWSARLSTAALGRADGVAEDDAVADRARTLAALRTAARAADDAAMTTSFRALLVLRAREVLSPRAELATALASLEALGDRASPAIVRAVIDGRLRDPRYGEIEPVVRTLARARAALEPHELESVCARARARTAAVGHASPALIRACAPGDALIPTDVLAAAATATTTPVRVGAWWLAHDGQRVVGAEVDVAAELAAQEARLAERGLHDARVTLDGDVARVEARRWREVRARATAWYHRKLASLLGAVVVATLAVGALARLRQKAQRREREVVELKARFAATVSHELQTPLAAVRVMAETLERRLGDEPRARDYPRRIVAEVDRLGGLVDNILAFQRIEQGRWEVRRERAALEALLPDLISEAERAAAGGEVEVDGAGLAGAAVSADPRLLRLALLNLVRNACRHNRRRPVRLALRARGQVVEVEDNGVGVPPEDVPRLFEEHARGRGAVGQGTGLGLALVARIARLHGGEVRLVRTSPEGSTFRLELGLSD